MSTNLSRVTDKLIAANMRANKLEKEAKELRAKFEGLSEITTTMKAECMGEFIETYEVYNSDNEDYEEAYLTISWSNMKAIYQMMLAAKLEGES